MDPVLRLEQELKLDAVVAGARRLAPLEALRLFHEAPLPALGRWATRVATRLHGGPGSARTYVIDRNINYSNVCSAHCTFCAFKRDLGQADAYVLDQAEIEAKVAELVAIGGTQILLQGGMHPDLPLSFYTRMLAGLKAKFPQVLLHAFSPPEMVEFVAVLDLPGFPRTAPGESHTLPLEVWRAKLDAVLAELKAAGLDSLPGGGGEIFAPHVRRRLAPGKADGAQWLEVMRRAHRAGLNTSASMMFGHIEGVADRIAHMDALRGAQDEAIAAGWPGRYLAFIAWPFQREHTALGDLPDHDLESGLPFPGDLLAEQVLRGAVDGADKKACGAAAPRAGKVLRMAGSSEYLRMSAVARLFLDNIPSLGSSWVTMGPHIGQMALFFGANDMGSVMMEENVVSAAGTTHCLSEPILCRLIREAGHVPAQRLGGSDYRLVKVHDGPDSPDLAVRDWSKFRPKKPAVKPAENQAAVVPLTIAGVAGGHGEGDE